MEVEDLPVFDFFSIPNALLRFLSPVSVPASCSFDIRWSGPVTNRSHLEDPTNGVAGDFVLSQATMNWSAQTSTGFKFVSDPAGTTSAFAQLGRMRNGVFFNAQDD
jgi:hypothetical protein